MVDIEIFGVLFICWSVQAFFPFSYFLKADFSSLLLIITLYEMIPLKSPLKTITEDNVVPPCQICNDDSLTTNLRKLCCSVCIISQHD